MHKKCKKCFWIFKFHHSYTCPRCNSESEQLCIGHGKVLKTVVENQSEWKLNQLEKFKNSLETRAKQDVCCYTSVHTRGFHHDSGCRKNPTDTF